MDLRHLSRWDTAWDIPGTPLGHPWEASVASAVASRVVVLRASRLPPRVVARALADLAEAGFLDARDEKVWAFHNWETYNPTREKIEAKRAGGAARQRKSWANRSTSHRQSRVSDGVSDTVSDASLTVTPSPPLPKRKDT